MDKKTIQNLFNDIKSKYIEPELKSRRDEGKLESDFKIQWCRIILPKNGRPIIEFNQEIQWLSWCIAAEEISLWQELNLHQIRSIEYVYPPKVDNEIAAMILLVNTVNGYHILMKLIFLQIA